MSSFQQGIEVGAFMTTIVLPLVRRAMIGGILFMAEQFGQQLVARYIDEHFGKRKDG